MSLGGNADLSFEFPQLHMLSVLSPLCPAQVHSLSLTGASFPEDARITPGQAEVAMMAPETVTCQHPKVPT